MPATYFAHSENPAGEKNPLRVHLSEVASLAQGFASAFGASEHAAAAGLLHDLGKYGDLFQRRLEGKEKGLDHWSIGASECLHRYNLNGVIPALAIQGHHIGLQCADDLKNLSKLENLPSNLRLTEPDRDLLLARLNQDGLSLPDKLPGRGLDPASREAALMLDVRMLFSALVDADYLATERHFNPDQSALRDPSLDLRASALQMVLDEKFASLEAATISSGAVASIRRDLREACRSAAGHPQGLFTLTAPTGAGKTLSMLSFALRHAIAHGLRRIVFVLPFLSIIDQTAAEYRALAAKVYPGNDLDRYLLEHHSLAVQETPTGVDPDTQTVRGLLAENWAAPIIVTTSVQLLESLFSNSPAACRKLHRLANSVVLFDEVQTLPLKLIVPTLAALSHLSKRYRASVVFATATQPAFARLDSAVKRLCASGWVPREIVPASLDLFSRSRRVTPVWPAQDEELSWEDLASEIARQPQPVRALCIVNVRRHAVELFETLKPRWDGSLFHLSTNMCPAHRQEVLATVRERLPSGDPCLLVSTQCIEAGVDVDFPFVYRALAPLDSIAQAAGRCNRNGSLAAGTVRIFIPEDARYPGGDYRQAAQLVSSLLRERGGQLPLDDPAAFDEYYRNLYAVKDIDSLHKILGEAIKDKDFVEVRKEYHLIEHSQVNVLVSYNAALYESLAAEVRASGLTAKWVRKARASSIGRFRPSDGDAVGDYLEPIYIRGREKAKAEDWFIHLRPEHYDPQLGLRVPQYPEYLEG